MMITRKLPTPPAVLALFIQVVTFSFIAVFNRVELTLPQLAIWQAILVLIMTRGFRLDWWWSVIGPLFPLAVVAMWTWKLPPTVYFLMFSFFLVSYWSTFRTRVPYYPSSKKVWAVVEKWLPENTPISFVDIGSGLGGLVLHLGKKYPESDFLGIEIAPLPWLLSYLRSFGSSNVRFVRQNYENRDFAQFDVVFAYLSPAAMPNLWIKARREMRPDTLLISTEFPIDGVEPDECIRCEKSGVNVYLWRI